MPRHNAFAVVAIPAHDEVDRIEACLAALATQRDAVGAPLPVDSFEIVVFANNCADGTVAVAEAFARHSPVRVMVTAERLPVAESHAGGARRRAMDIAAARLESAGHTDGIIMTTDADSQAGSTWVAATRSAIQRGADGVAGYVDAHPLEMMRLGPAFVARGRLEETYHRMMAEIDGRCDPRPHDPWPNHRVAAGASLAVTLGAYRAIGGLPLRPVGEDAALVVALERAGLRVRHALDVVVSTSCRFDGRVRHGAAETMRHRHAVPDAPCDPDLEPAFHALRRSLLRGRLRRLLTMGLHQDGAWAAAFGLRAQDGNALVAASPSRRFDDVWDAVSAASPRLRRGRPLRPSELPRQIRRAKQILRALRLPQEEVSRSSR